MSEVNYPSGTSASAPVGTDPGKTLGIIALVLSIVVSIVGAIVGIVARSKSKKAGYKNGFALAAIIIGFVLFALQVIGVIIAIVVGVAAAGLLQDACGDQPSGTVVETSDGVQFVCP